MKNNKSQESIFQKKGFYLALYSSIGLILVLSVFTAVNNLKSLSFEKELNQVEAEQEELSENVMNNQAPSYLETQSEQEIITQDNLGNLFKNPSATNKPDDKKDQTSVSELQENANADKTPKPTETLKKSDNKPIGENATSVTQTPSPSSNPSSETNTTNTITDDELSVENESKISEDYEQSFDEAVFPAFNEENKMSWPVTGKILMNYSEDANVFDTTLEQYRTNDIIAIESEVGNQVKAAADGIVRNVTNTRENGNEVSIDHGNGWMTTYSQLQDSILVNEGELVKQGQVIGGIASPSIYKISLGSHLGFKISHNNTAINPNNMLE
jgi:murein DD-endopeptidase MepM/ murein hydrolase activator NlpD